MNTQQIIRDVAKQFGVPPSVLLGKEYKFLLFEARVMLCRRLRHERKLTFGQIARILNRAPSAIQHAVKEQHTYIQGIRFQKREGTFRVMIGNVICGYFRDRKEALACMRHSLSILTSDTRPKTNPV